MKIKVYLSFLSSISHISHCRRWLSFRPIIFFLQPDANTAEGSHTNTIEKVIWKVAREIIVIFKQTDKISEADNNSASSAKLLLDRFTEPRDQPRIVNGETCEWRLRMFWLWLLHRSHSYFLTWGDRAHRLTDNSCLWRFHFSETFKLFKWNHSEFQNDGMLMLHHVDSSSKQAIT